MNSPTLQSRETEAHRDTVHMLTPRASGSKHRGAVVFTFRDARVLIPPQPFSVFLDAAPPTHTPTPDAANAVISDSCLTRSS